MHKADTNRALKTIYMFGHYFSSPISVQMAKRKHDEFSAVFGTPGVSDSSVRKIVNKLRGEPAQCGSRRQDQRFRHLENIVVTDTTTNVETVDLQLYVDRLCQCGDLKTLLEQKLVPTGDHLGIPGCVYADEVVPGNIIAPDNKRRAWIFYFCWLPLTALRSEFLWIPFALIRTTVADELPGGLPQVFTTVLNALSKFCINGIVLANTLVLTTSLIFLGDEDALKKLGSHKGASGLRPCIKCSNCISKGNSVPRYFGIEHERAQDFEEADDENMRETMLHLQQLHDRGMNARLQEHEKLSGWKYNPHTFCFKDHIWDLLRPSAFCYDSMHIIWGNGIANLEIGLIWEKVIEHGGTRENLEQFLDSDWESSMRFGTFTPGQLKSLACHKLLKADGSDYRGDAGQTLQLVVFLGFFVQSLFGDLEEMRKYINSFVALSHVCATILNMKMTSTEADSTSLLDLQKHHLHLFKNAYGWERVRPKHHYNFHVGGQTTANGVLLDCWALERKHKAFKSDLCQRVRRLDGFERSCLLRWVERDLESLASSTFTSGLTEPYSKKTQLYDGMTIGRAVQNHEGIKLRVGNVLLFRENKVWSASQIAFCFAVGSDTYGVIAEEMELIEQGPHCLWSRWRLLGTHHTLTMAEASQTYRTNFCSRSEDNNNLLLLR